MGFRVVENGVIQVIDEESSIQDCLKRIIFTQRGERALHPKEGTMISNYIGSRLTPSIFKEISNDIKKSIEQGEPRINDIVVEVSSSKEVKSKLVIKIDYKLK